MRYQGDLSVLNEVAIGLFTITAWRLHVMKTFDIIIYRNDVNNAGNKIANIYFL